MPRRGAAALLAVSALALAALFPQVPAQNVGARIFLDLEPSATVNESYMRQTARLDGIITVEKPPKVLLTVHLICTNDADWNSECSPNTIDFVDTTEAAFTCAVTIPPKASNTTATVVVHAVSDGLGTTSEAYANATVTAVGSLPTNGTLAPTPGPWGLNSPIEKALGLTLPAIALVATVIIVVVVVVMFLVRRGRRRSEAPPPQKGPGPII